MSFLEESSLICWCVIFWYNHCSLSLNFCVRLGLEAPLLILMATLLGWTALVPNKERPPTYKGLQFVNSCSFAGWSGMHTFSIDEQTLCLAYPYFSLTASYTTPPCPISIWVCVRAASEIYKFIPKTTSLAILYLCFFYFFYISCCSASVTISFPCTQQAAFAMYSLRKLI